MKGLLLKDWAFMKSQKTFYGLTLAFCVLYSYVLENASFAIGYVIILCSISTLNSLAYDEHDNGSAFLFSMPFSREEYVKEKYVFGILAIGISAVASSFICGAVSFLKSGVLEEEIVVITVVTMVCGILMMSLNLPIHLKYGAEKGKIILIVVTIGIFAILYFLEDVLKVTETIPAWIDRMSPSVLLAGVMVVGIVGVCVSMMVSVKIIRGKEF